MVTYDELCTAIIQKHIRLLGSETAIAPARTAGLTVDEQGKTNGSDKDQLGKLIDAYNQMTGRVTMVFTRSIVAKLVGNDKIDLPENLK